LGDFLYSIDVAVFRCVNEGWSCSPLNGFFSYITDFHHTGILLVIVLFVLYQLIWGGAKGRWLVLGLVVGVTLSDQGTSHLLKNWIQRIRPCNALPGVLTPVGGSDAYSFPSSHAANMGSSMFLLARTFPTFKGLFITIAILVGLSRVYLGLHYPSDVLGGYLFGVGIGWVVWEVLERIKLYFQSPVPEVISRPMRFIKTKERKKVKRVRKKR
jgi:undecaprenyl-diphosphatase